MIHKVPFCMGKGTCAAYAALCNSFNRCAFSALALQ